ncbi:MAG: hypothetical protein WC595_01455 [Candidatus Nanoarchaeia archaeon]
MEQLQKKPTKKRKLYPFKSITYISPEEVAILDKEFAKYHVIKFEGSALELMKKAGLRKKYF